MTDVSSRYAKSFFDVCVEKGCDPAALIESLGAGPSPFENPARRISNIALLDMLTYAIQLCGDETIGLTVGRNFRPSTFFDIGLAAVSCATMRQVIEINALYQPLTQQLGKSRLSVLSDKAVIRWHPYIDDAERMRPVTEAVFSGYAVIGRWLTWLYDTEMSGMSFRHKRPKNSQAYDELFGCEVKYEARQDEMEIADELIDMPLPNANKELLDVLCARLDRQLKEFNAPLSAQSETFHCVQIMLTEGPPTLIKVAKILGTSERTLRRRLLSEGVSYRSVVEAARKEACDVYIKERQKSIAEIAQAIGYSEQSAFTRAFKNWYGTPPSVYIANR